MQSRYVLASTMLAAVFAVLVAGTADARTAAPVQEQPATGSETEEPGLEDPLGEQTDIPEGIELTEGSGFRYESRGRRDPFVSLALGVNVLPPEVRPPGLQGMLIQEVSLRGLVRTQDGYIAMIQGTDNKSYFARTGERLYDGHIQAIDAEKVVFRQEINDPLRIEKFQEVEKSLHPVEEQR